MSDPQTAWENQRDIDCAEHNQPKCPKFPDHDCDECHDQHLANSEFNQFCETCTEELCPQCEGAAHVYLKIDDKFEESECLKCEATGRIKP